MAKRKHHKPAKSPTLAKRVELLENIVTALEQRVEALVAHIEWLTQMRRPVGNLPRGFLSGRWHLRDGTIYGDVDRRLAPQTPYEGYVRRSPPATE